MTLRDDLEVVRAVLGDHRGAVQALDFVEASITDLERERDEALHQFRKASEAELNLTVERDEALAHDRQRYPTADAYEKVCSLNLRYKEALESIQSRRDRINEALGYEFVGEYVDAALFPSEEPGGKK